MIPAYTLSFPAALLPITDLKIKQRYSFRDLMKMMSILRSADGCPWDREQTHESLRPYIIEEAYETVDAINRGDGSDMCEELGDVLYQIAFHAQIAREFDEFDISDVTTAICQKHCDTAQEVVAVWDEAKAQEKAYTSLYEKLAKIPLAMPALTRASKVAKAMDLYAVNDDPLDDSWGERFYRMVRDCRRAGLDPESELSEALRRRVERSANNEVPEPKDK